MEGGGWGGGVQACNQTQRLYNQPELKARTLTQSCLCNLLHNPDIQHINTDKYQAYRNLSTLSTKINDSREYPC